MCLHLSMSLYKWADGNYIFSLKINYNDLIKIERLKIYQCFDNIGNNR